MAMRLCRFKTFLLGAGILLMLGCATRPGLHHEDTPDTPPGQREVSTGDADLFDDKLLSLDEFPFTSDLEAIAASEHHDDIDPGIEAELFASDIESIQPWSRVFELEPWNISPLVNWNQAKAVLYNDIQLAHPWSLYCECDFPTGGGHGAPPVEHLNCGYVPRGNPAGLRPNRIEAEHVVPAAVIGRDRACWEGWREIEACTTPRERRTRSCCVYPGVDDSFHRAYHDLHNLFAAVGEVNQDRGSLPFTERTAGAQTYGECDFEVLQVEGHRMARPSIQVRGEIARAYLYMAWAHDIGMTAPYYEMMTRWDRDDPPECWEVERSYRIARYQGLGNPFVERHPAAPTPTECGFLLE